MAHAAHVGSRERREYGLDIDARRRQQRVTQRAAKLGNLLPEVGVLHVEDLAHEGVAVGVDAARGQGEHHVARLHPLIVDDLFSVHHADGKAREVVVVSLHGAGMLGGLAADEGAARLYAALRHAGDQRRHLFRLVSADGDVVEEEERLCPAADDVVDAHGHAVDAHGVVSVHELGDALLGAHAVGAGDEDRLPHPGKVGREETAKAADTGHDAGDKRALHMFFHEPYALVARLDVDAGRGIRCGMGVFHSVFLSYFPCRKFKSSASVFNRFCGCLAAANEASGASPRADQSGPKPAAISASIPTEFYSFPFQQ